MKSAIPVALLALLLAGPSCSSTSSGTDTTEVSISDVVVDSAGEDVTSVDAEVTETEDTSEVVEPQESLLEHVDPMIGTGGLSYRLGSAFVGAALPFGMAKLGPDTKHESWGEPEVTHCEGYWYLDTHVAGFSHNHIHGTGAPDYGSLLVVPSYGMDETKVTETGYMLALDHDKEHNEPGYYSLISGLPNIKAELTATMRAGVHRYTFMDSEDAVIIIDPAHVIASCEVDDTDIEIDVATGTFQGFLHTGCALSGRFGGYPMYFYGQFRQAPVAGGVWEQDVLVPEATAASGLETGAWFRFEARQNAPIELVVGISFVDLANAQAAFDEVGDRTFDEVREAAAQAWNDALGRGKATFPEDTPEDVRIQYYTSLYHAFLMPTVWSDADGRYLAFDDTVKEAQEFTYYTDFSMWDTYRTLHPLLFLLFPEESEEMVRSLMDMGTYSGCLPIWVLANGDCGSMIGRPASIIVSDAWLHGLEVSDEALLVEGLLHSHALPLADEAPLECSAEDGLHLSAEYGYVPYDLGGSGSVSKTQELAWGEYCAARVLDQTGREAEAQLLYQRSLNPYNLYNEEVGFFMGRHSSGAWHPEFDPFFWAEYFTEGSAWQYLWLVAHDPAGLAQLLGGTDTFFARLDEFFDETAAWDDPIVPPKHYFHGNEPDIHASFLYSALGRPASAAKWSRWIMDNEYFVKPEGIAGNDDAGTMAAWYVFATLGFYPIPCSGRYLLGSPRVQEAWLNSLGKPLHIVVENASESRPYIQSVTLNGTPVTTPWLTIEQLQEAGELHFVMAEEPTDFGTDSALAPLADSLDQ